MNLLTVDATRSSVEFAVFSTNSSLELVLSGCFDCEHQVPMAVLDGDGRVLDKVAIPRLAGKSACLCLALQWLDGRQIRIDAIAHQLREGLDQAGLEYLSAAYRGVPQVVCEAAPDAPVDLVRLAENALVDLSIPVSCPNQKSIRVRCTTCTAQ